MLILSTERLRLRSPTRDDGAFLVTLTNDPDFIAHIGDRGLVSAEDGGAYIEANLLAHQAEHGFGLWIVERRGQPGPLGMCGLLRRPYLPHADVGYAFLPAHRGQGYASEAAAACLAYGREQLGLDPIVALVAPDNPASLAVLGRLGLVPWQTLRLPRDDREVLLCGPPPARRVSLPDLGSTSPAAGGEAAPDAGAPRAPPAGPARGAPPPRRRP